MPARSVLVSPYRLVENTLAGIWNSFFSILPNIVGGLVFLLVCWGITRLIRRWICSLTARRNRSDLGGLLSSIATISMMTLAVLVAMAIVFPSVSPSGILSTLGIGSVAIGFAFRDILQNLFAGILTVINQPFARGDIIAVAGAEGEVERVEARATIIRTADGRLVAMPNATIYTSPLTIDPVDGPRRDQISVTAPGGEDLGTLIATLRQRLKGLTGVLDQPAPQVICEGVAGLDVQLVIRWWTATKGERRQDTHSAVVNAVIGIVK
ncbi:mechanosensitive ion channel family protein [Novosphingobium sp. MD-1]|uniref:mechanosensitive ion channel family protein n=1 Tax=Novosphingobium sp. MD-1 TaxID=1630648 RepID=UPI00061C32D8|nr:mechanosensitive ion channel domain-containing protein [Novosphingobium sp. MD-1]GAO56876.1 small-conductance mechanosensitive channel [Novosphingobium sp. MD-1]